jgi:hypothetical protein
MNMVYQNPHYMLKVVLVITMVYQNPHYMLKVVLVITMVTPLVVVVTISWVNPLSQLLKPYFPRIFGFK